MSKWSRRLTPELAEEISKRYDGTKEVIDQLCEEFNVPRYTIHCYASSKGLTKKRKGDNWSKEEIDFLYDNFSKGAQYVAKKLQRSPNAVKIKLNRLGVGFKDSHLLTANLVANILNIDIHVIT
ncbi:hypothetical protein HNQ80_005193 [Anaerosolibacter carboniphilus]|uniref:Uncharacterized protein n=1 Tax=Anaerosolibacter carboniphilus TaxID=1417629 RepID=A0A841L9V3_9FIRM|nr:hypothetical protein [Anaerosolibacter carboniphilus]MBB6219015.1 hypothetical protein [Anaerosolibacter carboniphilus]